MSPKPHILGMTVREALYSVAILQSLMPLVLTFYKQAPQFVSSPYWSRYLPRLLRRYLKLLARLRSIYVPARSLMREKGVMP